MSEDSDAGAGTGTQATDGGAPPGGTDSSDGGAPADAGTTPDASADTDGGTDSDAGTDPDSTGCATCDADSSAAVARGGQDSNTSGSPDRSPCLPQGPIQNGQFPSSRSLTTKEQLLLTAAIAGASVLPGIGTAIQLLMAMRDIANATGNTVAAGPAADVIGIAGGTAGYGIYFGPGGEVGVYGSVALDAGFAMGLSAEGTFTIVSGPPSVNFSGDCLAICVSGGEAIVGGLSIIFNTSGQFVGVSVCLGIGAGTPISVYGQYSHTWITSPS